MEDWAIVAPGTFPRLGPLTGTFHALNHAFSEGKLNREPSYITTSSVAAIPASVFVQRSEQKLVEAEQMEINLRKRQFVSLHPQLKKNIAVDFLAVTALLLAAYKAGKISKKHPFLSSGMLLALLPAVYKIDEKAVKDIFRSPSFFVYENLHKLLSRLLDVDAIFSSSIKIEIPAVDINKAGWTISEILSDPPLYRNWKNQGWVSVTNFRPEDVNLEREARRENYVRKMINGMRIQGHFNPGRHDNDGAIFDTATLSNMPIHFAIKRGYGNIVVLHYNSSAEGPTEREFDKWTESINRCGDISVAEKTRETILGCLRINNDLEQLDQEKRAMDELAKFLSRQPLGTWPELEQVLELGREAISRFSFSHKRKINILFVNSNQPIPDAHFSDFTQGQMIDGINIGWETGLGIVSKINSMIV